MITLINLPLINCFLGARAIYLRNSKNEENYLQKSHNLTCEIIKLYHLH